MSNISKFQDLLSKHIPKKYSEPIIDEYANLEKAFYVFDAVNLGIAAGHLCELISSLICFKELNIVQNLNRIDFNPNYQKMIQAPKPNSDAEILMNIIPNILKGIYAFRSRKRVAHFKLAIPQKIDIKTVKQNIDWVISHLLMLYCNVQDPSSMMILKPFAEIDIPFVEEFENGEILFLKRDVSKPDKLLYVIGRNRDKIRITKEEIIIQVPELKKDFAQNIRRLKERTLIHITDSGFTLTRIGKQKLSTIYEKLS
ncbi:hypothetical protein NEF87_002527 [Candidatus Lokiarchaeum ossiferum]|uniref:Uncharacterized protein n=1 Tax=Candidatus Lokiarchaeum ossiferum TaxID=2951803 RepID=A0ABY6HTP5_9ARCH|nr:hypothetical protein NEF87_002527 [Candidatus Lokiarchaeum sp. B-35]